MPRSGRSGAAKPGLVGILKRTGIASVEDARQKELVFGSTGTSSAQYYIPIIMNRLFGTRFKLIPGFPTTTTMYLAMERGELDGIYGAAEVIEESRPQWIAERQLNWLAQLNDVRAPDFPDVPLLQELAQAPLDKAAFKLLALARVPGKMLILPPDVPPARVAALREAFVAMLRDQAFIARPRQNHAETRAAHVAGRRASHSRDCRNPARRWSRMSASFST